MKKAITFVFLLYLSTEILTAPVQLVSRGDIVDEWFTEKYSNWWEWTDEQRAVVRGMYEASDMKHAWFPDHFDPPPPKTFTIYPESAFKRP